jgi:Flp pilus assembly protein TadB
MAAALQGACVTYPSRALTQWEKESNPDIKMTLHDVSWFGKYTYGITILVVVVIGVIVVAIVFVTVIVVVVSVVFLIFVVVFVVGIQTLLTNKVSQVR